MSKYDALRVINPDFNSDVEINANKGPKKPILTVEEAVAAPVVPIDAQVTDLTYADQLEANAGLSTVALAPKVHTFAPGVPEDMRRLIQNHDVELKELPWGEGVLNALKTGVMEELREIGSVFSGFVKWAHDSYNPKRSTLRAFSHFSSLPEGEGFFRDPYKREKSNRRFGKWLASGLKEIAFPVGRSAYTALVEIPLRALTAILLHALAALAALPAALFFASAIKPLMKAVEIFIGIVTLNFVKVKFDKKIRVPKNKGLVRMYKNLGNKAFEVLEGGIHAAVGATSAALDTVHFFLVHPFTGHFAKKETSNS